MVKVSITSNDLVADLFHDGTNRSQKAIIMLGGSEGGKTWSNLIWQRLVLRRLVARGYYILSLAYFKGPGLPPSLEEIPLEYFANAFSWLASETNVNACDFAIIGGSKGAELALVLASRNPQIKAVAALLPSSVVWQGIQKNRFSPTKVGKSSWSIKGKGLPFVPLKFARRDFWILLTLQLCSRHEDALQLENRLETVSIPIEKSHADILLISGQRDQLWPSSAMSESIMERLKASEYPYFSQHITFNKSHGAVLRDKSCWRSVFSFLDNHFA